MAGYTNIVVSVIQQHIYLILCLLIHATDERRHDASAAAKEPVYFNVTRTEIEVAVLIK